MSGLFDRLGQELQAREKAAGLSMADVLSLPDDLRRLFSWMMRREEVSLAEVAVYLGKDEAAARQLLAGLVERCFVREMQTGSETRYRVRLASKPRKEVPSDIWQALGEKTAKKEAGNELHTL
jgi:hypothetical protein